MHRVQVSLSLLDGLTDDLIPDIETFLELRLDSFNISYCGFILPRSYSKTALSYILFIDIRGCFVSDEEKSLLSFIGVIIFETNDLELDLVCVLLIFDKI